MIVLTALFQVSQPLQAATVHWDINGSTAGASGSSSAAGTWDAAGAFWNNAAGTGTAAGWNSGDIAVFSAGTNATGVSAITVSGTQAIGGLVFEEGTINLDGGTLQLTQDAIINVGSGLTTTLASGLTGTFNLSKTGAGTLDYQGNGAGVTGAVAVTGGTLRLSSDGVLTGASALTLGNRATLMLDNSTTNVGDRLSSGTFTSNGGTLNFNHGGAAATNYAETLGPLVLNAGALTVSTSLAASLQTSNLVFSTLARNTGATAFFSGAGLGTDSRNSVTLTSAPILVNSILPWVVVSNGTLTSFANYASTGGSNQALRPLALASHVQTAQGSAWVNTANVRPTADQTLSATRAAYTLTLDSGIDLLASTADRTLNIGSSGVGAILQTGGVSVISASGNNEYVLAFGANEAIFHILGDLTVQRGGSTAPTGGNISGTAGLVKSGPGALTVANSGMTGVFRLNEGMYRATAAAGLGAAAATLEFNGGTLVLASSTAFTATSAGGVTVNADAIITIDRAAAGAGLVHTLAGAVTIGSQTLTVTKGSLINADSNYGLTLSNTAAGMTLTGSPTFVIDNNGTGTGTLTVAAINSSGGLHTIIKQGTGNLVISGTGGFQNTVNVQGGQAGWSNNTATTYLNEASQIQGPGGVLKSGASTVNLTGSNTYTGATTITAGALQAMEGAGLPTDSNLVLNGGVFQTSGTFNRSLGTGAGQVQWVAGANGGFAAHGGALSVTLAGMPDPIQWDIPSFVSGAGALLFGSTSADSVVTFTHNIDLNHTGTALSRTFSAVDNTTSTMDKAVLSGVLSNSGAAGGITKTGNGVLELGAANTFTGPITVNAGSLQFTTVSDNGGGPSNLGQGTDNIILGGGRLQFIGGVSQSTNRSMSLTGTGILDASGTGGATITYNGAITAAGSSLNLEGSGHGILNGLVTQTGTTADLNKNGTGTWRIDVAPTIVDNLVVTSGTLILNAPNSFNGDDFFIRNATVTLNVNGAITNAMDDFNVSTETAGGGVLDINGTTGSAPTDLIVGSATLFGNVIDSVGTGSISATSTLALRNGLVSAALTGAIALNKTTIGTITLAGNNPGFTGAVNISEGGTLVLDYTTLNGGKLGDAALVSGSGGGLTVNGSSTAATTETIGGLTLTAGQTHVTVNNGAGQTATLILGPIARAATGDGVINFNTSSASASIQTTTTNVGGGSILAGWATFGGNRFATVSGGSILAATTVAADNITTWLATDNVIDSLGYSGTTSSRAVNSIVFNANATSVVTVAPGGRLNVASGGILVSSNVGTAAASITGGTLVSGTGAELFVHQHNTGSEFVIGSTLSGTTLLTKGGAGTLTLTGRNFHSGQTTIHEGTLKVSGGNAIGDRSVVELRNVASAILDLNNGTETIGGLTGGSSVGGTVAIGTGTLTLNNSATQVFVGFLTGSGTLIKNGASTQELEGSSAGFTGNVIVNQGLFHLDSTAGALTGATNFTLNGPTASLLSDQDGDDDIDRIGAAATITLNNTGGGNGLRIRNSNDQGEIRIEAVGAITLGAGHNVIMAEASNTTANTTSRLTAASLTRANQATVLVRGASLGAASGVRGLVVFTAAPSGAIGGGGGAASPTISIFPYMIGDLTAGSVGLGNSFVMNDATLGLRPLDLGTEYTLNEAGYNPLSGVTTNNVRFAVNPTAKLSGGSKTINSLVIDSTAGAMTLTGEASDSLTLASGALLANTDTPANATRLTGFASLLTGTAEYLVYTTNATHTLTVDSALATAAASLTKSGAGTLVLTSTGNSFSGGLWFNQGTIEAASLDNLGTGALNFYGGGLRWGTGATYDISTRTVTLGLGGGTLDTNGNDVALAAALGNGGAGGLTKAGAGRLTLNAPVTYTGDTTITGGTLAYGVANALPTSTNLTLAAGALDFGANPTTLASVTMTGNGLLTGLAALTITGDVVNSGGSRVLTIDNSSTTTFNGSHLLLSESATARTFTLAGTSNVTVNSVVTDGPAAASNLNYAGTGTLTLTALNTYAGLTIIDSGTVVMTQEQNLAGGLRFGSATSVTTTGTLDLTNVNATFGGVLGAQTNSATANMIIIGAGKTLTVNNNVSISNATDGAVTRLNMTGGGAFVVNGTSFTVGANSGTGISSRSFLDMSALASFTANLTGTFAVQLSGDNNSADTSALVLSNTANNIAATIFGVGVSGTGGVQSLTLGAGTNVLHANTFNMGTGGRDGSSVTFGPNVTGSVVIRDTAGTGRATFNMGTGGATTGVAGTNTFDVTGHNADLLLGVVSIGTQAGRTSALTNVFSFDQGTLDMTSLTLGSKGSAGTTLTTATFNIGGGTVRSGPMTLAATTTAAGTVVANLNITGGNVTMSGDIVKGAGPGNDTANFLLSGDSTVLDMGGFILGGAGDGMLDNVVIAGGTIKNLGEFNGGAVLVKTTAGTLTFDGTNTHSGATEAQEGLVIAAGGGDNRVGMTGLTLGSGTSSAVLQLGNAAGASNQTFFSLATSGTGTSNAIVNGNAAFSTLTVAQSLNTTFNGALGGAGANQNNLHLLKTGAGELVIGGPASLTGTVTVNEGKLFFDGFVGASTTLTSLTLADGMEFSLRGSGSAANSVYNFSGSGNVITVGTSGGATLGFALDGAFNTQLNLAAGQTLTVNGPLITAIYVNNAPNAGQQYVLINGADDNSIFASGTFNLNPVVFNGGSFTYSLSKITAGAGEKWVLTPSAQAAAADVWWKGDLTGIGTGVWSASTTTGTGFPTNWDTTQAGGIDALVPPDSGSIVHFSATGATNFATTLGATLTIQELIFHAGGTAISIGSSGGTNTLTLGNGTDASGLTLLTGAPNVSFSANIALAQAQAWNIAAGSSLTLSGSVSGVGPLTLNGDGTSTGSIIVSGPGGLLTYSGGTLLGGGWMILEGGADDRLPTTGALMLGSSTQGALLQLGDVSNGASNTTIGSLSSGTSPDSAIFSGASAFSTLTVNQTTAGAFHGVLGGAGADQNNLHLVKTGAAALTLNNTNIYAGSTTVLEGTLRLGAAGSIAQSASLILNANAGATATFDINGRTVGLLGGITLGGADNLAMSQIGDTAGGGLITLGGNIAFNPLNAPLGASITSNINLGGAARTFTADDSASATTDLTITGDVTSTPGVNTTGVGLVLTGTGTGLLTGAISLGNGTTDGSGTDLNKTGTGTWTLQGTFTNGDDLLISGGTLTLNTGVYTVFDDVVADNAGVILNINGDGINATLPGTASASNGLYARSGAVINILADNVLGTGFEFLILGDDTQGLGTLNLGTYTIYMPRIDLGFDTAGETGVITGTGTITGVTALNLDNGSISANLVGVGNIDKDNQSVTLSGNNALTGTTLVRQGTLTLDFTTNNGVDSKIGTGGLTMGVTGTAAVRSNLTLNGNASAASRQTVGGLTQTNGPSDINLVSNGGQDMVLSVTGALSRANGTLNLNMPTAATRVEYTGTTQNTNGIVGGWLTVNNSAFATISGGQIIAQTGTLQTNAGLWTAQANVSNSGAGGYGGTVSDACYVINSLTFDAQAVSTITVSSKLVISSGGILVSPGVGSNVSTITGGTLSTGSALGFIFHQNNTAGTLTIASNLIGGPTILKSGDGVLVLSGNNVTGAVTIDEGTLRLAGGTALSDTAAVALRNLAGVVLEVTAGAANSETIGSLSSGGAAAQVTIGSGAVLTLNQTAAGTFSGIISGAGGLTKSGTATLTVTGNASMTGPLVINQGRITLSGAAGALDNNNGYTLNGAEFLNVQDQTAAFSRWADSVAMTLNNTAGTNGLWLQRTTAVATTTENMGAITVGAGHNVVTVETGTGTGTDTTSLADLLADNLTRTAANHSTLLVRGTSLGTTTAGARRAFLRFESAAQTAINGFEVGGGGAANSSSISIIPWLVGDITAAGLGSSFVTNVDNVTGLRPLALNEYLTNAAGFNSLTDGAASNQNVRFDISPGAVLTSTATAVNSLVLDAAAPIAITGPANALEITSGAILAANAGSHTLGGFTGITTGGGRDYTVYVTGAATQNFTISSPLTSTVPLVKSGAGVLTLTGTGNAFTDVYLNQGLVAADSLAKLGTGTINFFGGGLRLSAGWTDDVSTKTLNISTGGGTLDVGQVTAGVTLVNGLDDSTPNVGDVLHVFTRTTGTGSTGLLTIQGSSSYTGTVIFRNSGIATGVTNGVVLNGDTNATLNGNVEIGNVTNINDGFDVVVALGANEQIVDTASLTLRGASGENAYFKLMGFTETVAGISDSTREGVIENVESTETGVTTNGRLIVDSANDFSYNAYLRNRGSGSNATLLEFEKRGTGTQTLTGDRIIYSGTTTITGGTLALQDVTNWASAILNNSFLTLNQTTGSRTHGQAISGTGAVTKAGAGTIVLSGANSYSGQTGVEQGVLSFSSSGNLGDGSATNSIRLANNATLQSTGSNVDLGASRSIVMEGAGGTVEVTGVNRLTASGALVGDECHTLTKTGDGVLVVSSSGNGASFKGSTQVNAGIVQVGSAGAGSSGTGSVIVAGGATLAGSGVVHGSTTIINTGAVLQAGDVTTVGTAASTVTGLHSLNFTAAGTALTVQNGGQIRLGIGSTATHVSSGVIDAVAAGTYTNALAYIAANGTEFTNNWNILPANATDVDFLNLSGTGSSVSIGDRASGTFGDGSVLVSVLGGVQNGQVFNLMDWQALTGITGTFDTGGSSLYYASGNVIAGDLDLGMLGEGLAWDVSAFAQYGILVVVAVPEPSRALLLLCGLLGLLMRRRRR